jgi:prevent-host-death family protein
MKQAQVSELKARLSAYLAEVRRGETVTVLDRRTPIALIVPFVEEEDRIEEPARSLEYLRALRPVRLRRKVDVVKLLRDSRDQR